MSVTHVLTIFGASEHNSDVEKANKGHIRSFNVKLRVKRSFEAKKSKMTAMLVNL